MKKYLNPHEISEIHKISLQRAREMIRDGRFDGAVRCACSHHGWLVPEYSAIKKPSDKRFLKCRKERINTM